VANTVYFRVEGFAAASIYENATIPLDVSKWISGGSVALEVPELEGRVSILASSLPYTRMWLATVVNASTVPYKSSFFTGFKYTATLEGLDPSLEPTLH
jgi:hypothetical protein